MSLITQCPACTTLFKVVPDQLRVSGGWVRCGQCGDVFDAQAHLQQAEVSPPASAALTAPEPDQAPHQAQRETEGSAASVQALGAAAAEAPTDVSRDGPALAAQAWPGERVAAPTDHHATSTVEPPDSLGQDLVSVDPTTLFDVGPGPDAGFAAGEPVVSPVTWPDEPTQSTEAVDALVAQAEPPQQATADVDLLIEIEPLSVPDATTPEPAEAAVQPGDSSPALVSSDAVPPPAESAIPAAVFTPDVSPALSEAALLFPPEATAAASAQAEPAFVRQARRQAIWRKPLVRLAVGAACMGLGTALAVQVAVGWRDEIVAHWPAVRPALRAICEVRRCTIEPLRRIDRVAVEGSSFERAANQQYTLTLTVRNTATTPLAVPHFELTLTDLANQVVVRRVLAPADFLAPAQLEPQAEWLGQLSMQTTGLNTDRISGYRVVAFYP